MPSVLPNQSKSPCFLMRELLARLAAVRLEVLVHAGVPHGIGHEVRPNAQRQVEQRLCHVLGRERKLVGTGTGNPDRNPYSAGDNARD